MSETKLCDTTVLSYHPLSGVVTWRKRSRTEFKTASKFNAWNRKHAGNEAGKVDPSTGRLRITYANKTFKLDSVIWYIMTGEVSKQIYHINGWAADNRWGNLTNDKTKREVVKTTKYQAGELLTLRKFKELEDGKTLYSLTAGNHLFSFHLNPQPGRRRMYELADVLDTQWEDLT